MMDSNSGNDIENAIKEIRNRLQAIENYLDFHPVPDKSAEAPKKANDLSSSVSNKEMDSSDSLLGTKEAATEENKSIPPKETVTTAFQPSDDLIKDPKKISSWFKEYWFVGLGVLCILLSMVLFLSSVITFDWIQTPHKIAMAALFSIIVYSCGYFLLDKRRDGGIALLLLGGTAGILTVFIANNIYGYTPPVAAYLLIFTILLATFALSIQSNIQALAAGSVLGAMAVPLLAGELQQPFLKLFYILVIDVATLLLVYYRQWGSALLIAWFCTLAYLTGIDLEVDGIRGLQLLTYMLFIVPSAAAVRNPHSPWAGPAVTIITMSPFVLYIWSFFSPYTTYMALGIFYTICAAFLLPVVQTPAQKTVRAVYVLSILFFFYLGSQWLAEIHPLLFTTFFSLLGMAGVLLSCSILKSAQLAGIAFFLFLFAFKSLFQLQMQAVSFSQQLTATTGFLISSVLSGISLSYLYRFQPSLPDEERGGWPVNFSLGIYGALLIFFAWHIPQELNYYFSLAIPMGYIICMALSAAILYSSYYKTSVLIRNTGIILLSTFAFKLIFFEIYDMPKMQKMITLFFCGLILISTAFMECKKAKKC